MVELHDAVILWEDIPAKFLFFELLTVILCVIIIAVELSLTRRRTSPAQSTRHGQAFQERNVTIFAVLAVLSFCIIGQFKVLHYIHSYQTWLHRPHLRMGLEELPTGLPGRSYMPQVSAMFELQYLKGWTKHLRSDVDPVTLLVEHSRNFWWTQQYYMGLISWVIFLGSEARIRGLRLYAVIVFAWLGLISLSFAQSLFYIFLILAPLSPSRRYTWTPLLPLMIVPVAVSAVSINLLRRAAYTAAWFHELMFICAASPVLLAIQSTVIPRQAGTTHRSAQSLHKAQAALFQVIAGIAFVVHIVATMAYVRDCLPFGKSTWFHASKTPLERTTTAAKGLFWAGPPGHAANSAMTWEIMLSTIAMCIWTGVGSVNTRSILRCTFASWLKDTETTGPTRRSGRGIKRKVSALADAEDVPLHSTSGRRTRSTSRKRDRSASASASLRPSSRAASRGAVADSTSERARSPSGTRQRRSTAGRRSGSRALFGDDEYDDNTFVPTRAVRDQASLMAHAAVSAVEEIEGPAEASALVLGLCLIGGLGTASAGVFGGEIV